MIRRALAILLSLAALSTFAATRSVHDDATKRPANAATVTGQVTAVNGNLIHLANGSIVIDATNAQIHGTSKIEVGMIVIAALTSSNAAANAPLPASSITATRLPDATLFGAVQSVDVAGNTLTVLGRTIRVTPDTSFGGVRKDRDGQQPGLADVHVNDLVTVTADVVGGQLVAKSILILPAAPPEVHTNRGKVKSIGADEWVIDTDRGDDLILKVNAQTKIAGNPKAGDQVEVLYRVDSANVNVALSIIKLDFPNPPFVSTFRVSGSVVSIAAKEWVVAKSEGNEQVTLKIGDLTKIEPGIAVGDRVEVLAQRHEDGSATALAIVKRRI